MNIELKGLTKEELIAKITVLISGIKVVYYEQEIKFDLKARWDEDGMVIMIGVE